MSDSPALLTLTAEIVSAQVRRNKTDASVLPDLIQSVYTSLATVGVEHQPEERQEPAVSVRKSIQHEYLVCLEDGAKMKMLKRYIAKRFSLTPAQYRAKWGLPADYPMVAPGYAERRSELAKEIGLGRKPKSLATELVKEDIAEAEAAMMVAEDRPKRGRKKAA